MCVCVLIKHPPFDGFASFASAVIDGNMETRTETGFAFLDTTACSAWVKAQTTTVEATPSTQKEQYINNT